MAFLRLAFAAIVLCAIWRSRLTGDLRLAAAFGTALGLMNLSFYEAIDRTPLGAAVAVEFAGPLLVAVIGSWRPLDWVWIALAAAGIVLLAEPGARISERGWHRFRGHCGRGGGAGRLAPPRADGAVQQPRRLAVTAGGADRTAAQSRWSPARVTASVPARRSTCRHLLVVGLSRARSRSSRSADDRVSVLASGAGACRLLAPLSLATRGL